MSISNTSDKTRSAVLTIIFTVFALALGDAIIKWISSSFTIWQLFVLRSLVVIVALVLYLKVFIRGLSLLPLNLRWSLTRSLLLTLMWIAYYAALSHIDLSVAAAAYYTLPLFVSMFAALLLGDSISMKGGLAILLGFVGVLLVLQPRTEDFNWFVLLPILAAILYALAMIITRSHCKLESAIVLSLWLNIVMLVTGVVATLLFSIVDLGEKYSENGQFLVGSWTPMGTREWLAIGVLSIAIMIGSIGAAYAYQNVKPAIISTFDFAYVAFAVCWGMLLFQEFPDVKGALGMMLIVFAGILSVRSTVNTARSAQNHTKSA